MKASVSPRDVEALSAYLDGELTSAQKRKLESRLAGDARLRAALEELRATRRVLRQTPKLRAPRNFTLTPQMADIREKSSRMLPTMQWVSALASILFVITVAGDLLSSSLAMHAVTQESRVAQPAMENFAAEEAESAAEEPAMQEKAAAPPQATVTSEAPQAEALMETEGQPEMEQMEPAAEEAAPAPMEMPEEGGAVEPNAYENDFEPSADQTTGNGGGIGAAEPMYTLIPTPSPLPTQAEPVEAPILGQESAVADELETPQVERISTSRQTSWLTLVEIGTAGIAVVSGGLVFFLKRKSK
jgi:anti-sigma factor RsiW